MHPAEGYFHMNKILGLLVCSAFLNEIFSKAFIHAVSLCLGTGLTASRLMGHVLKDTGAV